MVESLRRGATVVSGRPAQDSRRVQAPAALLAAGLPQPGDVLGKKYRVEECLGKGGMGMVFRATHLLSEKQVALKWMLRPMSEAQASGRFMREARAAGRIDHPNVVDVYDVGEEGRFGYLVMELLHGESLGQRLDRGKLDVTETVDLLLPAMRGVAAAHRAGVIHRDLKPDNVFLCKGPDGGLREAKVLDFGISSFTNADAGDAALTKDGSVLGTPAYMSPEQLKSSRNLDPRTDVYSLGVILYEALTGAVPFSDESFTGLVLAIAHSEPPLPSSLLPELSRDLEQVIMRAIARNRDDRYPDVESFIAALQPFASRRASTRPPPRSSAPVRVRTSLELSNLEFDIASTAASGSGLFVQGTGQGTGIDASGKAPRIARLGVRLSALAVALAVAASLFLGWRATRGSEIVHAPALGRSRPLSTEVAAAVFLQVPRRAAESAPRPEAHASPIAQATPAVAKVETPESIAIADESAPLLVRTPQLGARSSALRAKAKSTTPETKPPSGRSGTISLDDL